MGNQEASHHDTASEAAPTLFGLHRDEQGASPEQNENETNPGTVDEISLRRGSEEADESANGSQEPAEAEVSREAEVSSERAENRETQESSDCVDHYEAQESHEDTVASPEHCEPEHCEPEHCEPEHCEPEHCEPEPSPFCSAKKRENHRNLRLFAGIVAWLGATAFAGALTIVIVTATRLIGAALGLAMNSALWPMLVLWLASTLAVSVFWDGHAHRKLGIRKRDRLPKIAKRFIETPSMARELKAKRIVLSTFMVLPFIVSMMDSSVSRVDRDLPPIELPFVFGFGWLTMMLAGLTLWVCSVSAFRELRTHSLHNGLRFYHRGVALRSFISEWDNPGREIYKSCRLSRNISCAHSTFLLSTTACLSFGGCLAALIDSNLYIGEMLSLVSIISIGAMWPVPSRLVAWSAVVLDKFCEDPEEYETY